MNEWIQNDWGTKTREQCWRKFALQTFAPFLMNGFAQKYLKKQRYRRRPGLNMVGLVDFWCSIVNEDIFQEKSLMFTPSLTVGENC